MLIWKCLDILLCKNVVLCSYTPLSLRNIIISDSWKSCVLHDSSPAAFIHGSICCRSSFVGSGLFFVEIVEIVEHKIHIFLLFTLKVMYYSMVFVNFNSYMSVCLSRYGPWLYKLAFLMIIQIVVSLGSRNVHYFIVCQAFIVVQFLRSPAHWLIIEISTIFM
jgi:hypothetical protein